MLKAILLLLISINLYAADNCNEKWEQALDNNLLTDNSLQFLGLCDFDLRTSLHNKVSENHVGIKYKEVKDVLFRKVDNEGNKYCSTYSHDECLYFDGTSNTGTPRINIEHTWPRSKGAKIYPAESDMHHLYPTNKVINRERGNYPFCDIEEGYETWSYGESFLGFSLLSTDTCFEPPSYHKGNVARALFYFAIRYGHHIDEDQEYFLRKWHKEDPVDSREMRRNNVIESVQFNRNPFIDAPELVDFISDF